MENPCGGNRNGKGTYCHKHLRGQRLSFVTVTALLSHWNVNRNVSRNCETLTCRSQCVWGGPGRRWEALLMDDLGAELPWDLRKQVRRLGSLLGEGWVGRWRQDLSKCSMSARGHGPVREGCCGDPWSGSDDFPKLWAQWHAPPCPRVRLVLELKRLFYSPLKINFTSLIHLSKMFVLNSCFEASACDSDGVHFKILPT